MRIRKDLGLYRREDGQKKYTYAGGYLTPGLEASRQAFFKALMLLAALVCALLAYAMGRLNLPSFRALYVILPFLGLVYAVGRCLWAAAHLFSWKERMTVHQFAVSWKSLQLHALVSAALSFALILSVLAFILWGGGVLPLEGPLMVLCALSCAVSLAIHKVLQQHLPERKLLPEGFV